MAKGNEVIMYLLADNKDLKAKLSDAQKSISDIQKKTEKGASGMASAMKRIGGIIATYFGVQAIRQFVNFAGTVDSVTTSFNNLARGAQGGAQGLLSAMREASAGTMSNLQMMRTANLAMQLMGDQVIERLPQMARIARAAAMASGRDVNFMFESLVVATGRQSILVLDNLGISSATASRYMDEYARSINTTADKMTAAQKSQAFFYAAMKAGEELVDRVGMGNLTLAEHIQRLSASSEDLAASIATRITPSLKDFAIGLNAVAEDAKRGEMGVLDFIASVAKVPGVVGRFMEVGSIRRRLNRTRRELGMEEVGRFGFGDEAREMGYANRAGMMSELSTQTGRMRMEYVIQIREVDLYEKKLIATYGSLSNALRHATDRDVAEYQRRKTALENYVRGVLIQYGVLKQGAPSGSVSTAHAAGLMAGMTDAGMQQMQQHQNQVDQQAAANQAWAAKKRQLLQQEMSTYQQYYQFMGDARQADIFQLQASHQRQRETIEELFKYRIISEVQKNTMLMRLEEGRIRQEEDLAVKHNVFMKSLQEDWQKSFTGAYGKFESATKDALMETITGENGWDAWQKTMKSILKQLVVDLMYAIAKAMLLKAVTAAIGGPTGIGGGFVGGLIKGAFFEKGYIPEFSKGRIPVLANGMMPSDHFPAYIGTREAVINAESTRANLPLLAAMNANPGASMGGDVNVNVVAEVDGEVLFRVNEKRRQERATALGMQNYGRRSVYR